MTPPNLIQIMNKTKEHPILFSAPMVRAIQDGRKTQTRRAVKPPLGYRWLDIDAGTMVNDGGHKKHISDLRSPYGQPGDSTWRTGQMPGEGWYYIRGLLSQSLGGDERPVWVQPKHFVWGFSPSDDPEAIGLDTNIDPQNVQWKRPSDRLWVREQIDGTWGCDAEYVADRVRIVDAHPQGWNVWIDGRSLPLRKIPSIHMPRWASRITLDVTDVRVERLQDISRGDAMAEGCTHPNMQTGPDPRKWYAELWEAINGPGSWDANPWVRVIEFNRCD